MCGIAGIWNGFDKDLVGKMMDKLRHRGPDAHGMHVSNDRGILGHRRLSIMDPEGGNQPIYNEDKDKVMHYPGIGIDATEWLIKNRALGGLGIDTHGVDPGADETYATNTALLRDDRIHLENLAGLEQLPAKGAWIVVGGVRNDKGSGSPATVFGFLP